MNEPIENYYMKEGIELIDLIFDKGYFCPEVTREDLRKLDEYIAFVIQYRCRSAVKSSELLRRIRQTKSTEEPR